MKIWECDMCGKPLRNEADVFVVGCSTHSDRETNSYDLCAECANRVEGFIRRGLEPTIVPDPSDVRANQPRKTCDTCVHLLTRKSRCLKKNIQIHENDRDACMDWSDKKTCTNCRDAGLADGEGVCTSMKAIFQGERGYCGGWHS